MSIIDNVLSLMKASNINQNELCDYLHIGTSTMSNWKIRGTDPPAKYIIPICEFLNISPEQLLTGKKTTHVVPELSENEQELIAIYNQLSDLSKERVLERAKVLFELETEKEEKQQEQTITITSSEYRVSAGRGVLLGDDNLTEITVPDTPEARKADFALTICGDSMEPIYHDGDVVLVRKMPSVEVGEIGIFYVDGGGYIKKYGGDRLISLNSAYDDILLNENTEIRCFGKVIGRA